MTTYPRSRLYRLLHQPWWLSLIEGLFFYALARYAAGIPGTVTTAATALVSLADGMLAAFGMLAVIGGVRALYRLHRQRTFLRRHASLDALRRMDWESFERLVAEAFRRQGYQVLPRQKCGADGGIDLVLKRGEQIVLVQCKHWRRQTVGVSVIRELYGVMVAKEADRCMVVCTGRFSRDAWKFVQRLPIELIGGQRLVDLINDLEVKAA